MDHTHIVKAGDLERYADTRESEAVIPELVYWLIKQSTPPPTVCRIPYGDVVNQPGWDGLVEIERSFLEYVSQGASYWEIGTGSDPQAKATSDFKKRTEALSAEAKANSVYVFVTPRSSGSGGWDEPRQTKWLNDRKDSGWRAIRIIDGVKLADWLREFPAVGRWMAKKLGLTNSLGGLTTPTEHWELVLVESVSDDPPLPPKLFTEGRTNACEALNSVFEGKTQTLLMFAESPQDVADFVAAYLQTLDPDVSRGYANRCLYITDEQAWRSVVSSRVAQVLVADPRLGLETEERADLQALARKNGHSMIIPLCGAWSKEGPEIIKLRSPSQSQIEAALKEAGFLEVRARELARIGGNMISALRRNLRGLGNLPPYATWESASLIAQAGLAGKWDGTSPADRAALEQLLGKGYGEWIEKLRPSSLRSDSPLIQIDEKWCFLARGEAWGALGNRITDADLERFEETAVKVLGERDPRFDLPKEERHAAAIHDKVLQHSRHLRNGIAETLALLGSRPDALSSCTHGKANVTAKLVVRKLLNDATWNQWASLDSHIVLLAEAAPDEFLDAVEAALENLDDTPFHELFAQEGGSVLGGWNYMSGLLWALETLAWNPDYLSRVAVILADLASFDPGGNWANRPANSLVDIFLPWHFQTIAPFEKRRKVIETVLREHSDVGWKLLLALLPHSHGSTSGCHRPTWRDYIPRDWKSGVLRTEYWDQVTAFTDLAVALARQSTDKLQELINRLPDLPRAAHESLLAHLGSTEILGLPEAERLSLWEKLEDLVRQHRKFADADWALSKEAINKIEEAANKLAPETPELRFHHLFSDRDFDLFDEKGDYEYQRRRLDEARQVAAKTILGAGALAGVLEFANEVTAPYEVGRALGSIASDEIEAEVLPSMLNEPPNSTSGRFVAGFVWARYWGRKWNWVDAVLERDWKAQEKAAFFIRLPFEDEVWQRVGTHLGVSDEGLYWKDAWVNPYGPDRDLTVAIEKLLQYGRPSHALLCVARTVDTAGAFSESLAIKSLIAVLETPGSIDQLDNYRTVEVIKRLQQSKTADQAALFKIEWNFLPWLDRFSTGSPVTLERKLSADPAFFAEVVGLVFRSRSDEQPRNEEPDKQKKYLARNGYKLLSEWQRVPGTQDDGRFDVDAFNKWIAEARRITEETGHAEVAQIQIGHVLTRAPADPGGLWIHETVADLLNQRNTGEMRSGFTTQLFNDRGVHGFTYGEEERKLASDNRERAEALDSKGYTRFATAMREFAEQYERQAEREAKRDPFED
jgi:hypothetical protein